MRRLACVWALLLGIALGSCSETTVPATAIILEITADDGVRQRFDRLKLQVRSFDGDDLSCRSTACWPLQFDGEPVPRARIDFPVRVPITPVDGDASRVFEVMVEALADDAGAANEDGLVLVRTRAVVGYTPDAQRVLPLHLQDDCLGEGDICRGDGCFGPTCDVCRAGLCEEVGDDPFTPTDGGMGRPPVQCGPDDAQLGDTACGPNGRGVLMQRCSDGVWVDDPQRCEDDDVCKDGAVRRGNDDCMAEDGVGQYEQRCVRGQWENTSRCMLSPADCDDVAHGQVETRVRYETSMAPFGQSCRSETQTNTCDNGSFLGWTGTFEMPSCTVLPPRDCQGVAHGEQATRVRYEKAFVPFGDTCVSETQRNTCEDGSFLGWTGGMGFAEERCVQLGPDDCGVVADGERDTRVRYQSATVPFGSACVSETQENLCSGGAFQGWTGTYTATSCVVGPPADCGAVAHGGMDMRVRYESAEVPFGDDCVSETQTNTCDNGSFLGWTGTYTAVSCDVLPEQSCGDIQNGQSDVRTRYLAQSVPFGESCQSEEQTNACVGGAFQGWTGTYTATSCTVQPPANCGGVAHGEQATRTRYAQAIVPFGDDCVSQEQTADCYDGTLGSWSGTYTETSCRVTPPTDGMVLFMPFDGSAQDQGTLGNDGMVVGATPTRDRFGQDDAAYYFDGSAYIMASGDGLPLGDAPRTMTFWLRPDNYGAVLCGLSGNAVVANGSGECQAETFGIGYCSRNWYFWSACYDVSPSSSNPAYQIVDVGQWNFIAVRFDGGDTTVFIDGVRTDFDRSQLLTQAGPLIIGATSEDGGMTFDEYYEGAVDDVRIFDRALSDAEIEAIRNF